MKLFRVVVNVICLSVFLTVFSAAQNVGTVDVSTSIQASMTRHLIEWTSNASGVVTYDGISVTGYLKSVEILSAGTPATGKDTILTPTTAYDVKILNDMRRNIIGTIGDDVPTTSTGNTQIAPKTGIPVIADGTSTDTVAVHGRITVNVSGAGAARKGWIALYFDRYNR